MDTTDFIKKLIPQQSIEFIEIKGKINTERRMFKCLEANKNNDLIFYQETTDIILNSKAQEILRWAIGWTYDTNKWRPIEYKGNEVRYLKKIVMISNMKSLKTRRVKASELLRDAETFDLSTPDEYYERFYKKS